VHLGPKHKFCIFLHTEGFLNAQKDNQTSLGGKWSRMDAFGAKPFLQLRDTKIVHLGPKHKSCIFLHAEGFLNAPNHNQTSFAVQWSRMDAFSAKPFPQLRYTKVVQTFPKQKFCIFLLPKGFLKLQKTTKHHPIE
jgi:hypothetical protein